MHLLHTVSHFRAVADGDVSDAVDCRDFTLEASLVVEDVALALALALDKAAADDVEDGCFPAPAATAGRDDAADDDVDGDVPSWSSPPRLMATAARLRMSPCTYL